MPKPSTREAISSSLIRRLRDERLRLKLSMNVLAQRAGLHVSMISLVERELRKPTFDVLLRIAEGLEIDLWRLVKASTDEHKAGVK